jgi:hypothetical protein
VADVGDDDRYPVPSGTVLSSATPTVPEGAASPPAAPDAQTQPSWTRILATTVKLWAMRRVRPPGSGRERGSGPGTQRSFGHRGDGATRRWRLAVLLLALAVIAVAALGFAALSRTARPAGRVPSAGDLAVGSGGQAGAPGTSSLAAAARAQAVAWIVSQVSSGATIACDAAMCAALQAEGVSAGRLLMMPPGSDNPLGASVVITSSPTNGPLADEYAPAVIASFGSGASRVEVRATESGGAAAYQAALRADLAARESAGAQLLRNWHIRFTRQDAAQLRAGEVDSRLLATLAALSSQYSFRVTAFGDASPGVQVLYREVTLTTSGSGDGTAELASDLALVNAQDPPYQPAHAVIIHPAAGQAALIIEFAAPSPLGLLTAVLAVDQQGAAGGIFPTADPVPARKTLID